MSLRELALYAGAGGSLLAGHRLGWRTVCAVEIEPYCRDVLGARQCDGTLSPFLIHDDVDTFDGHAWRGRVDVLTAGFPCPPFSVAGAGLADADARNLWPATLRVIREVEPPFVLLENVRGILSSGTCPDGAARGYAGTVLRDLVLAGYDVRWVVTTASDVGAPHLRARWWVWAWRSDGSAGTGEWWARLVGKRWVRAQAGLWEPLDDGGTWPPAGEVRAGHVYLRDLRQEHRRRSGPHYCPFLTPSATPYGSSGNGSGNNVASRGRPSLEAMARRWPTPRANSATGPCQHGTGGCDLQTAVARAKTSIPTPTAGDAYGAGNRNLPGSKAHPGTSLTDYVVRQGRTFLSPCATDWKVGTIGQRRGQLSEVVDGAWLNPTWVEWLMGWPLGWTSPDPLLPDEWQRWQRTPSHEWWASEPCPRTTTEHQNRPARLHALGNGWVPAQAVRALEVLR